MKTILAFAGSNSSTSINFELIKHTVSLIDGDFKVQLLKMHEMPFPMYSADSERNEGFKNSLIELHDEIKRADGLIISVNEHNGNPSAYFKNVIDWLSRFDRKFLGEKKILLMSTSPGARGGMGSLSVIQAMFPRFGAEIVNTFSLPSFGANFDEHGGIINEPYTSEHQKALNDFLEAL